MLSARIPEYKKPLDLQDVQMPSITSGEEVIVRVATTGLCHSDLYIINCDLKDIIPLNLPSTPGHEIAGWVKEVGNKVPESIVTPGDMVAVLQVGVVGYVITVKIAMNNYVVSPDGQV
ncbi:MAG: alcohol dehydrogenase catalytic domain-containing protein [Nitrososphaeraceae archaeon]